MVRLNGDRAIAITELANELRSYENRDIYIIGDGYDVAHRVLEECGVKLKHTPTLAICESAVSVAKVALRKYKAGECVSDSDLMPTYLRLPQAERERLEREGTKNQ